MKDLNIIYRVRKIVSHEIALSDQQAGGLTNEQNLHSLGLDSMSAMGIYTAIEEQFGIEFGDDVGGHTFESIDTIAAYVTSKLASKPENVVAGSVRVGADIQNATRDGRS